MRIYNYIYYRIYYLLTAFDDDPNFAAIIVLCWLFLFNLVSLLYFLSNFFDIIELSNLLLSISGGILVFGGHLAYFYINDKYSRIIDRFENERKRDRVIGIVTGLLYIALTIMIFMKYTLPNAHGIGAGN